MDGSFIQADANNGSRIPREELSEAAHVNRNVRQYLDDLERDNPLEPELRQQTRCQQPIPTQPTPAKTTGLLSLDISTIILWITQVV